MGASANPADEIRQGHALLRAGRAAEALQRANGVLLASPDDAEALFLRGLSFLLTGKTVDARNDLQRVAERFPDVPDVQMNLGLCLAGLGQYQEAECAFRNAIRLRHDLVEAHCHLCDVLVRQGRHAEAVEIGRGATKRRPDSGAAFHRLGAALLESGRAGEAIPALRKAIRHCPDLVEAHVDLAAALTREGRLPDALEAGRMAISMNPAIARSHLQLGEIHAAMGQRDASIAAVVRALELDSGSETSYRFLDGILSREAGMDDTASGRFGVLRRHFGLKAGADERKSDRLMQFHRRLGLSCIERGLLREAERHLREALELAPENREVHSALIFSLNYRGDLPPGAMLEEAVAYGRKVCRALPACGAWPNAPDRERTLRVGLVSGDLGRHPVGFFLAGPVAAIDPGRFSLFAYSTRRQSDSQTNRLKAAIPNWREVEGDSDEELIGRIGNDGIDILIDLSGHSSHNRLPVFAAKPAPVQAAWLGYFATTGLPAVDWIIADRWALPPDEEAFFAEKPWRLPDAYYCFTPPDYELPVSDPPALHSETVTFGCFNNASKLNDAVIECWSRILRSLPRARLFLKARQFDSPDFKALMRARFERHGIAGSQLLMEGNTTRHDYFKSFHAVDIALDPFPYTGGTTSVEGLWMGVPVLTLKGDRFIAHQGETILQNIGLPGWIADGIDEYVEKAALFASDAQTLSLLRKGMRERLTGSALCDAPRFARNLEDALRGMWKAWCAGR